MTQAQFTAGLKKLSYITHTHKVTDGVYAKTVQSMIYFYPFKGEKQLISLVDASGRDWAGIQKER